METGYALAVDHLNEDSLSLKVSVSRSLMGTGPITVVAHTNGMISYTAKNDLTASTFNASVSKSRFPTGILHVTLFSPKNEPVAERLVFINRKDQLNINLSTNKEEYNAKEKVKLLFDVQDGQTASRSASLSSEVAFTGNVL